MENKEQEIVERLESAATLLERTLNWLEERQGVLAGEVEKISATVEQGRREQELEERLSAAERELADLKAGSAPGVLAQLRKTVPASTTEMLAKHGLGEGPVDVRTLDAALAGLSLEQRIAVKSQLLRAGAIA
jgi:F0F1-type ATP synthase membrane subunit b/b'